MDIKEEPAPEIHKDQYFNVKKIIDWDMDQDGNYHYKVKWAPTWEAAHNLTNCEELIEEFWAFFYRSACHMSFQEDDESIYRKKSSSKHKCDFHEVILVEEPVQFL